MQHLEISKSIFLQVDGSHLPPCFTDKDILARFKLGTSLKPDKVLTVLMPGEFLW